MTSILKLPNKRILNAKLKFLGKERLEGVDDTKTNDNATTKEDPELGVSVYWLKTGFMEEVKDAGQSETSTIREIEDLKGKPGIIRKKGKNITSQDGKMGVAYVHCLNGEDNVGKANFMLSYTWSYTIGDIVDTLVNYCQNNELDSKRTYIWICCLCNNQHRVVEDRENGVNVPFDTFREVFKSRVLGTGHLLAMMSPWNGPKYIQRVWCVFELFTANQNKRDVGLSILMPPKTEKDMLKSIVGGEGDVDDLYEAFSKTDVKKAKASVETDREMILKLIEDGDGFEVFNNEINELSRKWVHRVIDDMFTEVECLLKEIVGDYNSIDTLDNLLLSTSVDDAEASVKRVLMEVDNECEKSNNHMKALVRQWVHESINDEIHSNIVFLKCADFFNNVGEFLWRDGNFKKSHEMFDRCRVIRENTLGKESIFTAQVYNNIGLLWFDKGQYDKALSLFKACKDIEIERLGGDHPDVAISINNIGGVYFKQGDTEKARQEFNDAINIQKKNETFQSPDLKKRYIAKYYNNIAGCCVKEGKYDEALDWYGKAHAEMPFRAHESMPCTAIHPDTATVCNDIGSTFKGDTDCALKKTFRAIHPDAATMCNNVGSALDRKGDTACALKEYQKALKNQQALVGKDHLSTLVTFNNIGVALHNNGDYDGAITEYDKALKVFEAGHPFLAKSYQNKGIALYSKGSYNKALEEFQKALKTLVSLHDANHPEATEVRSLISKTQMKVKCGDQETSTGPSLACVADVAKAESFMDGLLQQSMKKHQLIILVLLLILFLL